MIITYLAYSGIKECDGSHNDQDPDRDTRQDSRSWEEIRELRYDPQSVDRFLPGTCKERVSQFFSPRFLEPVLEFWTYAHPAPHRAPIGRCGSFYVSHS